MRLSGIVTTSFWVPQWFAPQTPLTVEHHLASGSNIWDKIKPSETFQWQPCFGDFKCARLRVPMDWQGTSSEVKKTVEIAVIKLEATVPITDSTYGGAIVLNPGGPGGSGVEQLIKGGHSFRTLLSAGPDTDHSVARNFDVIGFDPRGINNTTPQLICFPDDNAAAAHVIEEQTYGFVDTSATSFDNLWAMKRAFAQGCSERTAKEGIAKHVSTAAVARDIVEIFERHGQWRASEAERLLASSSHERLTNDEKKRIRERTAYHAGREMVQYWGFSYGTVLGGTLSAMFPDRIKRAVLDGVVDWVDYMAAGWTTNLRDTDRQLSLFGEYCFQGGAEHCPMYDSQGPSTIVENLEATLAHLAKNPIAVPGDDTKGPSVVTLSDFKEMIWKRVVYNPLAEFPLTAQVLSELQRGNGTTLAERKVSHRVLPKAELSAQCQKDGPYSPACNRLSSQEGLDGGASAAIACSDGLPRTQETKEEFRTYADQIVASSSLLGARWAAIMMPCTAWNARPHWRYDGDFHAQPAHPILFIGNTVDPVTPLHNAFEMAGKSEGAGVLHQNSEGHCSTASVSMCTGRALRAYFQTGTLPGAERKLKAWKGVGEFCEPDLLPLSGYRPESARPPLPKGEHDVEMWEALLQLNLGFL